MNDMLSPQLQMHRINLQPLDAFEFIDISY